MSGAEGGAQPVQPSVVVAPTPRVTVTRGFRVMAGIRWLVLAAVSALAGTTVWRYWVAPPQMNAVASEAMYSCPMHPEIRMSEPGQCPICHMDLEPIAAQRRAVAGHPPASQYPTEIPTGLTSVGIEPARQRVLGLATTIVQRHSISAPLRVPALLSAPESGRVEVRVRAPGFVERAAVRQTGVRVRQGQELAWVYSPEIYRAQQEFLTATRWKSLPPGGPAGSQAALADVAGAARRALELLGVDDVDIREIVRTGQPVRALAVRSPIAGTVTRFASVPGARADPERALYEITDLSSLWILASVNARDRARVHVGEHATFTVAEGRLAPLQARVDLIEPQLNQDTRTVQIRLILPNRDHALLPGLYGEVEIAVPNREGLFVVSEAVIHTGDREYVYLAVGADHFEPRLVQTGGQVGELVEVLAGLAQGDRVVSRATFMLDSESRLAASIHADVQAPPSPTPAAPPAGAARNAK